MATTTTTTTETVSGITDPSQHLGTLFLRGETEAIDAHAAHRQPRALNVNGNPSLRADRNYAQAYEGENPENWPEERGVPRYRPLERGRSTADRPFGANTAENVFLYTMFSGVLLIGQVNTAWRATVGRFTSSIWSYPVGGQY